VGIGDGFAVGRDLAAGVAVGRGGVTSARRAIGVGSGTDAGSDDIDLRKHVGRIPGTCAASLPDGPDSAGWTHNRLECVAG